jgi:hypothetical protein
MAVQVEKTHSKSYVPYNGHNPNNCTHCGQQSANWCFKPNDQFDKTHKLCNSCISNGALYELGIKGEDVDSLTKFNHN